MRLNWAVQKIPGKQGNFFYLGLLFFFFYIHKRSANSYGGEGEKKYDISTALCVNAVTS